jgi:hypothetical protein
MSHQIAAVRHENTSGTRENAAVAVRANAAPATRGENSAITRAAPRENNVTARENDGIREAPAASRQVDANRSDVASSTPWQHFSGGRGETRPAGFPAHSDGASSATGSREGMDSAPGEGRREEAAPSDSWGRFSTSRAQSYESTRNPYTYREAGREDQTPSDPWRRFSASRGESYGGTRTPYQTERNPYAERGSYASYSRGSYPSYSGGSYPSYSRGSYPSYSRGSYPSYSHGSYPSYSHGSYPSYSRGSYPSYSHGSYGSAPSSSRGYSAPPHPPGDSGGRAGGGRPPH